MQKLQVAILGALLYWVPFLFSGFKTEEPIRYAKLGGIAGIAIIPIFVLFSEVSISVSVAASYAVFNTVFTGFGPLQINVLLLFLLSLVIGKFVMHANEETLRIGLKALFYAALTQAAWGIFQKLKLDPIFVYTVKFDEFIPVGSFGQQTILGPFLVCGVAAALFLGGGYLLGLIPLLTTIVLIHSSMTFVSLGAVLAYYGFTRFGWKTILTIVPLIVAFLLVPATEKKALFEDNCRGVLWLELYHIYMRQFTLWQKLIGLGGGSFWALYPMLATDALILTCGKFQQAHNEYLNLFWEFGAIGAAIAFAMLMQIAYILYKTWGTLNRAEMGFVAVLFAILANSVGNFPLHLSPYGTMAAVSFIILVGSYKRRYPELSVNWRLMWTKLRLTSKN